MIRDPALATPVGLRTFGEIRKVARARGVDPHVVGTRYVLERFLARLFTGEGRLLLTGDASSSRSATTVTLKGGLTMCFAEDVPPLDGRSTSDADLHVGDFEGDIAGFSEIVRAILATAPEVDDGVTFDLRTLKVARVKEGAVPGGAVTLVAQVGLLPVQVKTDVSFDDRPVHRLSVEEEYPSVLQSVGVEGFLVRRVPFSYAVADKLQAMARLGNSNFRIRDYYDVYVILSRGKAVGSEIPDALRSTLELYDTRLPASTDEMQALSDGFVESKSARWDVERRTKGYGTEMPTLREVMDFIKAEMDVHLAEASTPVVGPGG